MDQYYVKKVYLGNWRYRFPDTGEGGYVPPGFAVFSAGLPLVYKTQNGRIICEVYGLKRAATQSADFFNREGSAFALGHPIHVARERGQFPHLMGPRRRPSDAE